jgi:pimeloyl-ACP methyl ester carboxylesterase
MNHFVEGAVNTNQVYLHYWRSTPPEVKPVLPWLARRRPRPPLLLLHAATESSGCWTRVAEALRREYDIVVPDARGHGLSEAPPSGYGIEDRANDVIGLIQSLELDRPVLIGHALGAETAIGAAALFPSLIRGVVLEDPPWPGRFWGSTTEERTERAEQWRAEILQQKALSKKDLLALGRDLHPDWPEEELLLWAVARHQVSPNLPNLIFAPRRRWSDYVRQAECPILLLIGEPGRGATVNEQTAREAAVFWKDGRVVQVRGAGHHVHRDQLKAYLRAVRDFLNRRVR